MLEYKSEIIKLSIRLNAKDAKELNDLVNKNAMEGWQLVAYAYGGDRNCNLLVTFKKSN